LVDGGVGVNRVEEMGSMRDGVDKGCWGMEHWSRGWGVEHRSMDLVEDGSGKHAQDGSSWHTIFSLNGIRITLLSAISSLSSSTLLSAISSLRCITLLSFLTSFFSSSFSSGSGFSMESKMFSAGSSNFWGVNYGYWGNKRARSRSRRAYREVGGSNTEAIDGVGDVMGSLEKAISVDILVAATDNTESVLGFRPGRVDVLVAEAELTELVLGVELAGGSHEGSGEGSSE
jgi:hypothetical protein